MKFTVITLFPAMIEAFASEGLLAQARGKGLVEVDVLNPRQFTEDVHHTVDDRAFGGGDGMVMKVEPLARAVTSLAKPVRTVVLSPQGRLWDQAEAEAWAARGGHVALVCGRYAGIDHRFNVAYADDEISLGDYVLNGGEVAACAIIESVARLVPGVLGNAVSAHKDSFAAASRLLECPQFTRPREIEGPPAPHGRIPPVPEPLLSGDHARIAAFERAVSLVRTAVLRPDLLDASMRLAPALKTVRDLSDGELLALGLTRANLTQLEREWT
jgi:tRNA (guanine37-N1)-methyltransferase